MDGGSPRSADEGGAIAGGRGAAGVAAASPATVAAAAAAASAARAIVVPPHQAECPAVEYTIVIPTRGRWRPAREISGERSLATEARPFVVVKTLAFLRRQRIPPSRVELWVADEEEAARYRDALQTDPYWAASAAEAVRVGVPGILQQRNCIVRAHREGEYIVSLDDDVAEVYWKQNPGNARLVPLPEGSLERLLWHARKAMATYNSFIWGLASTIGMNPLVLHIDGVMTKNGEVNGFFYGFVNRHAPELQPQLQDATEDAERSLRYFKKDGIMLRYRMYCCDTKCFRFAGGLQDLFEGESLAEKREKRKEAERLAAGRLHELFPELTFAPKAKHNQNTLEVNFRRIGLPPVPTTTVEALSAAKLAEAKAYKVITEVARSRRDAIAASGASAAEAATSGVPSIGDADAARDDEEAAAQDAAEEFAQEDALFDQAVADSQSEPGAGAAVHARSAEDLSEEGSQGGAEQNREERLRLAFEKMRRDLVLRYNGDDRDGDPMERALRQSQELSEQERRLREAERADLELATRLSMGDSGAAALVGASSSSSGRGGGSQRSGREPRGEDPAPPAPVSAAPEEAGPPVKRPRAGPGGAPAADAADAAAGAALAGLLELGFGRPEAARALADAGGDVDVAAAMLLSAAATVGVVA